MAKTDILLREGEVTPQDIRLYDVQATSLAVDIFLYVGETDDPANVRLRDTTTAAGLFVPAAGPNLAARRAEYYWRLMA